MGKCYDEVVIAPQTGVGERSISSVGREFRHAFCLPHVSSMVVVHWRCLIFTASPVPFPITFVFRSVGNIALRYSFARLFPPCPDGTPPMLPVLFDIIWSLAAPSFSLYCRRIRPVPQRSSFTRPPSPFPHFIFFHITGLKVLFWAMYPVALLRPLCPFPPSPSSFPMDNVPGMKHFGVSRPPCA